MWAGPIANIPSGWLLCDGSAKQRSGASAALFAVIGTIYGSGDGSTTFNLPNFQNRLPMGAVQDDAGVPKTSVSGSLAQTGGTAGHTLSINELPSHNHDITHTHTVATASGIGVQSGLAQFVGAAGTVTTSSSTPATSSSTGGNESFDLLNPYFSIVFIIYGGT